MSGSWLSSGTLSSEPTGVGPAGICHSLVGGEQFALPQLLPDPASEKAAKPRRDIYKLCFIIICQCGFWTFK